MGNRGPLTLNRRQAQLLGNVRVLDAPRLVQRHPLDKLRQVARARNRGPAPERLEAHVRDGLRLGVHADLELHHVTARRRADEAGAHVAVGLVEGARVARPLVVVDDLVVVEADGRGGGGDAGGRAGDGGAGGGGEGAGRHAEGSGEHLCGWLRESVEVDV